MKKIISILLFQCIVFSMYAATCSSVGNGNWNQNDTWSCGAVPGCGDTIIIAAGHTVSVTSQINLEGCEPEINFLIVYGTLEFTNGNKLQFPCGSFFGVAAGGMVTKPGPGGGSSTLVSICGNTEWKADYGNLSGPYNWILPVEFKSFKLSKFGEDVLVEWKTGSELNNDYFLIERSKDGIHFEVIGKVKGAGNSSYEISYQFLDEKPLKNISYYRIKQVDFDGIFAYTSIKSIGFEPSMLIYPNPINQNSYLTIENIHTENTVVQIFNLNGKLVDEIKIENNQVLINVSSGIYYLSCFDAFSGFYITEKIVVL